MEKKKIKKQEDLSFFERLLIRFRNWIKNAFLEKEILTPVQQLAFEIFEICLNDDNNIVYLDTKDSDKRYIVSKKYVLDKDISTFIILNSHKKGRDAKRLVIVNHTYMYDVEFPEQTSVKMVEMFDEKVRQEREEMEREILGNITSSLAIVLADFKKQLEETKISKKKSQIKK